MELGGDDVKKIGILASVVARKKEASIFIHNGECQVCVGEGDDRDGFVCGVDDDEAIEKIIEEINFGRCKE